MKVAHKPSIATCIIKDDEVAWSKGYGYYDLENQKETNNLTTIELSFDQSWSTWHQSLPETNNLTTIELRFDQS